VAGDPVFPTYGMGERYEDAHEIFVLGTDAAIWRYLRNADGSYTGSSLSGTLVSNPVVLWASSTEIVFARGSDNAIWQNRRAGSSATFGGWTRLTTNDRAFSGDPIVGRNKDGSFEVFAFEPSSQTVWRSLSVTTIYFCTRTGCASSMSFNPFEAIGVRSNGGQPQVFYSPVAGTLCLATIWNGAIRISCQDGPGVWTYPPVRY
jgi:hypothetical protein